MLRSFALPSSTSRFRTSSPSSSASFCGWPSLALRWVGARRFGRVRRLWIRLAATIASAAAACLATATSASCAGAFFRAAARRPGLLALDLLALLLEPDEELALFLQFLFATSGIGLFLRHHVRKAARSLVTLDGGELRNLLRLNCREGSRWARCGKGIDRGRRARCDRRGRRGDAVKVLPGHVGTAERRF